MQINSSLQDVYIFAKRRAASLSFKHLEGFLGTVAAKVSVVDARELELWLLT